MEDLKQKVERYLDGICDGFKKEKSARSVYYKLPHNIIRVSDHTSRIMEDCILNVFCPIGETNIIVLFMNQIKVFPSYMKFTDFIKVMIWIIQSIENNFITNNATTIQRVIKQNNRVNNDIEPKFDISQLDTKGLTKNQIASLVTSITEYNNFEETMEKRISNFRKTNNKTK